MKILSKIVPQTNSQHIDKQCRNDFFFKVSGSILLLMLLIACNDEFISPDGPVIADNVNVISDQTWNQRLISLDSTNYTITFSKDLTTLKEFKAGNIIISSAGEGLLRRVKSVSSYNNELKIQTEFASLTDAVKQGKIEYRKPLAVSQIESVEYNYNGIKLITEVTKGVEQTKFDWEINTVLYDKDSNLSSTYDQVRVVGLFSIVNQLVFEIDIDFIEGLKEVKFGIESYEDLDLKLISGIQYDFDKEKTLAKVNFSPITISVGIVPVVITPQLKINIGVKGSVNGAITSEITQDLSLEAGVQYLKDKNWDTYKTFEKNLNFQPPHLYLDASAKAYIKPELTTKLYTVAGPFVNLELYSRLDANILQIPWWKLYAGITMNAGVKGKILDLNLVDYTKNGIISYEQLLGQSTSPPIKKPTVSTSSAESITSSSAKVGGTVTEDGGSTVTTRGIYYGLQANPELTGIRKQIGSGLGIFSTTLTGLVENTRYFVKAFAVNSVGEAYGDTVTFKTIRDNTSTGKISGVVKDASTSVSLSGVSIGVYLSSSMIMNALSQYDGRYEVNVPANTGYKIVFSKTGYLDAEYWNINVTVNSITILEPVLQVNQYYAGNGNIGGTIVNALNGSGIPNVLLVLRRGINVTGGSTIASAITNSTGQYTLNSISAGNYTIEASNPGFNTTYFNVICLGGQTISNQDATMSPILTPGTTRIVLTWGSEPPDLDSHFTGPLSDGNRFHMYFYYSGQDSPWPDIIVLDLDDINGYGPETTTLLTQINGVYRFSVHDYSNRMSSASYALSNSGAQVKVYQSSGLLATFNVPPNKIGTLWTVFEINNNVITAINEMTNISDYSDITKGDYQNPDLELFRDLKK